MQRREGTSLLRRKGQKEISIESSPKFDREAFFSISQSPHILGFLSLLIKSGDSQRALMEGLPGVDTAQGFVYPLVHSSQNPPQVGAIITLDLLRKKPRLRRLGKFAEEGAAGEQGARLQTPQAGPSVRAL